MAEWVQILQLSTKYIDLGLNLQFIRGFFVNCALFFVLGADRIMVQSKEGEQAGGTTNKKPIENECL